MAAAAHLLLNVNSALDDELVDFLRSSGVKSAEQLDAAFEDEADLIELLTILDAPAVKVGGWTQQVLAWRIAVLEQIKGRRKRKANQSFDELAEALRTARSKHPHRGAALPFELMVKVKEGGWRTSLQKKMLQLPVEDGDSRAKLEKEERDRWLDVLIGYIKEASLPVLLAAATATDSEGALRHVAGTAKWKTLRNRCKTWAKIRDWLRRVHGVRFPAHVGHVIDYLQDLVSMGCGRSVPGSVAAALAFMEKAGGVEERITLNTLFISTVEDLEMQIKLQSGWTIKKAPVFALRMLLALELFICSQRPKYKRFVAWIRLLKVYGCLRFDDTKGLVPERIRLSSSGLRATLERSKTTGPGRKTGEAPVFVDRECSLTGGDWLKEGFEILKSPGFSWKRDYLLPKSSDDLESCVKRQLDYSCASGIGRSLLLELKSPIWNNAEEVWQESDVVFLLTSPCHLFWTEHSERHVLPSWSAALGVDKSKRDDLGRWGIDRRQSQDYVATARLAVTSVQREVLQAVSEGCREIDEDDLMSELGEFLRKRGATDAFVKDAVENLTTPRLQGGWFGLGQAYPLQPVTHEGMEDLVLTVAEGAELPIMLPVSEDCSEPSLEKAPEEEAEFWITLGKAGQFRKLHRKGGCFVDPVKDCSAVQRFWDLDGVVVHSKCKLCFRKAGEVLMKPPASPKPIPEEDSSVESSSSEVQSEVEDPQPSSASNQSQNAAEGLIMF
jgi:hypothetical protein